MRNPADYFGLVAYMFVMYGGLPGSDMLWSESYQEERPKPRRGNLRVVGGNDDLPPAHKRRRQADPEAEEIAA